MAVQRRGSKVVMHWSAKPVCAGSIPALASTLIINGLDELDLLGRNNSLNKVR